MKIICFTGSSTTGNSETFIRKGIADMRKLGWTVEVVSGRRSGSGEGVHYTGFSESNWALQIWRLFSFLNFSGYAKRYMKLGFEIRQWNAQRKLKPIFKQDADFYWFDYLNYACYAEKALKESQTPYAIAIHGFDASQELSSRPLREAAKRLQPRFYVSPSNHLRRRLELLGVNRPIHVIPYDSVPARSGNSAKKYDFMALGRLTPKKCPEGVLMAFEKVLEKHPDATLVWVGSGELEDEIKGRFSHLVEAHRVVFTGALEHNEAIEHFGMSDVFVQHSVTGYAGDQEGLPNSIVEAMRHGKPVVSTLHSGISEIIFHNENGLLVQEHDYESFAEHMLLLLREESLRQKLGSAAKASIQESVPLESRGKKIEELIRGVVQKV